MYDTIYMKVNLHSCVTKHTDKHTFNTNVNKSVRIQLIIDTVFASIVSWTSEAKTQCLNKLAKK